ncbi:MAG: glycosyltransferase family 4 protein, partial [Bacteroidota bacterium]|nr:glycosyltransferase family 4 protein [Bacteroidota bacterium]
LYTGRIHPEKGIDLLIKSFKSIKTNWKLKIVGPSEISAGGGGLPYLNMLKALADDANIEFSEPIYNIDVLNKFYEEASIFAYPSVAEQGETFGLAALEAMAWGCVPVVSDLACFKDFIHHDSNGVVFNHRDKDAVLNLSEAIERLQSNFAFLEKLGVEALNVRSTHSSAVIADEFLTHFTYLTTEAKKYN